MEGMIRAYYKGGIIFLFMLKVLIWFRVWFWVGFFVLFATVCSDRAELNC